jgi:hypothetical protein
VGDEALVEVEVEGALAEGSAKLEEDKELRSRRHLDLARGYGRKLPGFQSRRCREESERNIKVGVFTTTIQPKQC